MKVRGMSVAEYLHVRWLAFGLGARVAFTDKDEGAARIKIWLVTIGTKSRSPYLTGLHELGHLATAQTHLDQTRRRSFFWACWSGLDRDVRRAEAAAWRWAKRNAIHWTREDELYRRESLESYGFGCTRKFRRVA